MTVLLNRVRRGAYADSVALMRLSSELSAHDGVEQVAVMIGTPSNKDILADAGLLDDAGRGAEPGDMIVAIRADSEESAATAFELAESRLGEGLGRVQSGGASWRPRTLRAAVAAQPGASLAVISVPGAFAAAEARKALRRGLNALVFSDNVPVQQERALKEEARERGLIVMGPDCGTAILGGVPIGFANVVPRGRFGIIGASGTGTQEVSCLLARHGAGISHAIGVGGRDLANAVGGISTLTALDMLDADEGTGHVILISKPPSPAVAEIIAARIAQSPKRFTLCFLGAEETSLPENAGFASTLKGAALAALGLPAGARWQPDTPVPTPLRGNRIVGLYTGGTLAAEAQVILLQAGQAVSSNAPVPGAAALTEVPAGHCLIDLGDDAYTRGRPHPMIEPSVRSAPLANACRDATVGAILADVVIGHGAHADPAGEFIGSLESAGPDRPLVLASVTGTDNDPQNRSKQIERLRDAGVIVAPTNADAAAFAASLVQA